MLFSLLVPVTYKNCQNVGFLVFHRGRQDWCDIVVPMITQNRIFFNRTSDFVCAIPLVFRVGTNLFSCLLLVCL